MTIRVVDLPESDRPRERLIARGVEALSERELIALLIRHGRSGESALDLAARLVTEFGGLGELATARLEDLVRRVGIGTAKAAGLVAAFELGRRIRTDRESLILRGPADLAEVAGPELSGLRSERLIVLVCNGANRVRLIERISEGSADRALVPVREILSAVLRHDGRAFALVHNHPSGDPTPSEQDKVATDQVDRGATTLGLRFLGHVVVAGGRWAEVRYPRQRRD
jgi:DNA repair protein RadC